MTKKLILTLTCLFAASSVYAQGLKVGVVEMESVFQEFYKTIKAELTLQQQTKIYKEYAVGLEKEVEERQNQANQLRDDSLNLVYSEGVRQQKREEAQRIYLLIQDKRTELREYQNEKKQKLRLDYEKSRADLVEEIAKIVQEEAQRRGLDLVLDSSGKTLNGIPAFIYFRKDMDFTASIIETLNAGNHKVLEELKAQSAALRSTDSQR
ncbi:MAG: Skp family chaperone for outer membrane protein [Rhodothermales bacterium]|jgi:Skp family chaperone for outer membrane proteins